MEKKFKIGDIVKLKTESPEMTVSKIHILGEPNSVLCSWFDGVKPFQQMFHQDSLDKVVNSGTKD